ncbi:MAG: insulinase family protein [Acidobacteria bacterium]|nr:insulinase family protein [Acidobacteriota bacterium]
MVFTKYSGLLLLFLILLSAPFGSAANFYAPRVAQASALTYPIVKRDSLLNGLQLITLETPGTGTVTLRFRLNSGALFDLSGKGGLADVTAGMLLRGGGGLTAKNVLDTVELSGLRINVLVNWDATDIELSGPTDALDTLFDLLGRLVINPTFDQKELDELLAQRAAVLKDEAGDETEALNRQAAALVYGAHPLGRPVRGTLESIKQISRNDLLYFHKKFYIANNAMLFASGDLTAETVTKLARTKLGSMKKGDKVAPTFRPPETSNVRRVLVREKSASPTVQAVLEQRGFSRRAQDYFAALVMSEVLRASLNRQLATAVSLTCAPGYLDGPLTVDLNSSSENFLASLNQVLTAMNSLQEQTVAVEQVEAAKALILARYAEQLKSNPAEVFFDVELYGLGRDYLIRYADRVNAVAVSDVQQAARKYLKPQSLAIVVAGNTKALEPELKKLGNLTTTP